MCVCCMCMCVYVCFAASRVTGVILVEGSGDVPVCEYVCRRNGELHMNVNQ